MISRSASMPALDRHSMLPPTSPGLRCALASPPRSQPACRLRCASASLDLRKVRSLTDLPALVDQPDATEALSASDSKTHFHRNCSTSKTLARRGLCDSIVPLTIAASRASIEDDAQNRSPLSCWPCTSRVSTYCGRLSSTLDSSGVARSRSRPELPAGTSEDDVGGSGGRSTGHGGPHGRSKDHRGPAPDPMDIHYQKLLQSDPENPLLLRNYAQFLSQIKHDYRRAEEYYERAILASPGDGEVLSSYARHMWDIRRDAERAASYFDQAVQAAPDDCYILGSCASFLWQSEEADESYCDSGRLLPPSENFGTSPALMVSA